jgi:hypothetical protein
MKPHSPLRRLTLIPFTVLLFSEAAGWGAEFDLYLFAGQSDMDGWGRSGPRPK